MEDSVSPLREKGPKPSIAGGQAAFSSASSLASFLGLHSGQRAQILPRRVLWGLEQFLLSEEIFADPNPQGLEPHG